MTLPQILSLSIVAAMMGLFVWGRLRYDLVGLLALLASIVVGIVPAKEAFSGFSDDIVIIVGSALVVSAGVARSGVVETLLRPLAPHLKTVGSQVGILVGVVTALSALVKNIGALAMLIPVAFQLAKRNGTSPSALLMPMAFGSLLGGIVTLVGTSPNIIVSKMRQELVGKPFGMFDFTPVGLAVAVAGFAFLCVGYRLLPGGRRGAPSLDTAFNIQGYATEALVTETSTANGITLAALKASAEDQLEVTAILRDRHHRIEPKDDVVLRANDLLILEADPESLERFVAQADLKLMREQKTPQLDEATDEIGVMEAVVTGGSMIAGRAATDVRLFDRYGVNLIALSRRGQRVTGRLKATRLREGDVIVLQGNLKLLPDALGELGCLPLAGRDIRLGAGRRGLVPVAILIGAMVMLAINLVPVSVVFFASAVLMLLLGALTLREAYDVVDWPILVMLGALIPVSETVRTTGATDLIAGWLSVAAGSLPAVGALALIMMTAMAVTPFLNNAATVLVMAPIAASLAKQLGYNPDAFLMAVAIGAASDFLTPIGHQCNTLVMGPGGYRFGDYWRLGLPLTLIVLVVGVPLIALFWLDGAK